MRADITPENGAGRPRPVLASRPSWLPGDDRIREFFRGTMAYPYYKVRLVEYVSRMLPEHGDYSIVDVGAGDGYLGAFLTTFRPHTQVIGVETFVRPLLREGYPLVRFDGRSAPFADRAFDCAVACNVLHHADAPDVLFREMLRITRNRIVIKDHIAENALQRVQLHILDQLGNRRFAVDAGARYLSRSEWGTLLRHPRVRSFRLFDGLSFRSGPLELLFGNHLEAMLEVELFQGGQPSSD